MPVMMKAQVSSETCCCCPTFQKQERSDGIKQAPDHGGILPPRFSAMAHEFGMHPSIAFDLRSGWDLDDQDSVDYAWKCLTEMSPAMLFTSPKCAPFSTISNLNKDKPGFIISKGVCSRHLAECIKMIKYQISMGRFFCHEHPLYASSWSEEIAALAGVTKVECDQCMLGQGTWKDGCGCPQGKAQDSCDCPQAGNLSAL